jgi:hypothetical protein
VKEQRHTDAVHVVAGVVRWGAAHVKVRHAAGKRRYAGQGFDGAERVAESTGHLAHVGLGERGLADLAALAEDGDFGGWFCRGC